MVTEVNSLLSATQRTQTAMEFCSVQQSRMTTESTRQRTRTSDGDGGLPGQHVAFLLLTAAAAAAATAAVPHLVQRLARVLPESGVEEAVDQWVDGVVDEERLDAELVDDFPHGAQPALEVLDGAAKDHHHQVGQEAQDVGQGHGEQDGGGLPHADLSPLGLLRHFRLRLLLLAAAASEGTGEVGGGWRVGVVVVVVVSFRF